MFQCLTSISTTILQLLSRRNGIKSPTFMWASTTSLPLQTRTLTNKAAFFTEMCHRHYLICPSRPGWIHGIHPEKVLSSRLQVIHREESILNAFSLHKWQGGVPFIGRLVAHSVGICRSEIPITPSQRHWVRWPSDDFNTGWGWWRNCSLANALWVML